VGAFTFVGGHRLWRAPEAPAVTYVPDHGDMVVRELEDGLSVSGLPDPDGIRKTIALYQRDRLTVVDHTLRNEGGRPVRCAAWAITQMAPGGLAVLPQSLDPVDADGVLPNRSIVFWPYTDPSAPEIDLRSSEVRVLASVRPAKAKLGVPNQRGWLAYALDGELFVKWSPLHRSDRAYADLNASVQCYRDHRFLELETLGPLEDLEPGDELHHREIWTLIPIEEEPLEALLAALPADPLAETE
jgi:hypothetical protein